MKSILKKTLAVACMGLFMSSAFAADMMKNNMPGEKDMSAEKSMSTQHHKMKQKQHRKMKKACDCRAKMQHKKMQHKKMQHKKMKKNMPMQEGRENNMMQQ